MSALSASFNSLQTGKRIQSTLLRTRKSGTTSTSFNSLQTGKRIQRLEPLGQHNSFPRSFQFPSNGKAYPKPKLKEGGFLFHMFQFPSNGKAYPKRQWRYCICTVPCCFNSLQTGKRIQSFHHRTHSGCDNSFNSLQTGKRIQSRCGTKYPVGADKRFNSLQTGKRIQSSRRKNDRNWV